MAREQTNPAAAAFDAITRLDARLARLGARDMAELRKMFEERDTDSPWLDLALNVFTDPYLDWLRRVVNAMSTVGTVVEQIESIDADLRKANLSPLYVLGREFGNGKRLLEPAAKEH